MPHLTSLRDDGLGDVKADAARADDAEDEGVAYIHVDAVQDLVRGDQHEITSVVTALSDLLTVLRDADPAG